MTQPIRADRVKEEPVRWLWRERIPKGMISIVAGKPDQGKGLFAAHLAADVSTHGGKVLYSAAEDSHSIMTRPRLRAAGARLENILLWRFQLPRQFKEVELIIRKEKIALVVIDPIASHLSGGINRHSDSIRQVLGPLTDVIEETGTAVLIVEHVVKRVSPNSDPLQAIGGSGSGLVAAARAGYLLGLDPRDDDKRVMACVKCNVAEKPQAVTFDLDITEFEKIGEIPSLVFDEELDFFDPMAFFKKEGGHGPGRPPDKKAAAAEWLSNYLAQAGGPVPASKILEDCKHYGMSQKTLRRAAVDMKVVKSSQGRGATWDLPQSVKDLMGLAPPPPDEKPEPAAPGGDWDEELAKLVEEMDDDGEGGDE